MKVDGRLMDDWMTASSMCMYMYCASAHAMHLVSQMLKNAVLNLAISQVDIFCVHAA